MLEDGETEEVGKILNQRSIVERDGKKLKAVDYCDKFKEEFTQIADELDKAAETSTNKDFNVFGFAGCKNSSSTQISRSPQEV